MGNTGQTPYPPLGDFGGQGFSMSSGISFTKEELAKAGTRIGEIAGQSGPIDRLNQGSNDLHVPFPHFGVIGLGIQGVHEKAIQSQSDALTRAQAALRTWETALADADRNYKKADDDSGDGFKWPPGAAGDLGGPGGIPGPGDLAKMAGLKNGDLPGTNLPGTDLPGTNLPKVPDGTIPGGDLPGKDLPGTNLPGTDLPGTNLPGTNLPGTNLPNTNLPNGGLPQPNVPATDPADMKVPSIDSALNNPGKTDLSQFQPTTPPINTNLPSLDPSTMNRTGTPGTPGTFGGPGGVTGTGMGLGVNGGPPGGPAVRGAAAPGMGMPFVPMGGAGAGAGGDQQRDREKTVGLSEDEGVWMGDEDIAPQVIGLEDQ